MGADGGCLGGRTLLSEISWASGWGIKTKFRYFYVDILQMLKRWRRSEINPLLIFFTCRYLDIFINYLTINQQVKKWLTSLLTYFNCLIISAAILIVTACTPIIMSCLRCLQYEYVFLLFNCAHYVQVAWPDSKCSRSEQLKRKDIEVTD